MGGGAAAGESGLKCVQVYLGHSGTELSVWKQSGQLYLATMKHSHRMDYKLISE